MAVSVAVAVAVAVLVAVAVAVAVSVAVAVAVAVAVGVSVGGGGGGGGSSQTHLERLGVLLTVVPVVPFTGPLSRDGDARDGERHEHDEAQQQREMPT